MRLALLFLFLLALPLRAEPLRIEHRFGMTVIDAVPERVVSVGYHEQDFLYALGIAPVGVHEWFGDRPFATWSWAEAAREAAGAEPEVQRGFEIDFEWVWALKPDLIVATFAPMDAETYARLSRIAPVVGPPAGYPEWGAPWQEELRLIGRATGRGDRAEDVIGDVEAVLRGMRARHPGLQGRSAAAVFVAGTTLVGYGPEDGTNRFLAALGLSIPPDYGDLATEQGNFSVSLERIDLFDHDVALWLTEPGGRELVEALPAYRETRLGRERRSVWADAEEMGAMSFQSPLSIPWAAERLGERLERAATGAAAPAGD